MRPAKWLQLALCLGSATAVCVGVRVLDESAREARAVATSYRWARQIASQAEGLMLSAQRDGEKDPLGWAVNFLAQGEEPRIVRVTRGEFPDLRGNERTRYDSDQGTFDYVRILTDSLGVQIRIDAPRGGFLGVQSMLTADLLTLAIFLMVLGSTFSLTSRIPVWNDGGTLRREADALRERVVTWVGDARQILLTLGARVRDLIREAQHLAESSSQSRDFVHQLRDRTHSGIRGAALARKELDELEHLCRLTEVLALNLRVQIEKSTLGRESSMTGDQLHVTIKKLKAQARLARERMLALERELEPISADADQAAHAFEGVATAVQALDGCIDKTKESLLRQAHDIQDFSQEIGDLNEASGAKRAR